MILPSDSQCCVVIKELADEPTLTEWEAQFIESNQGRTKFSDRQKEVIAEIAAKYDL